MFLQRFDPDSSTWTYLLSDDISGEAVLIDPVLQQVERDLALLKEHGLELIAVVDTHVHADHITAASALKTVTGATTAVGADCNASGYDRALNDGDEIAFGAQALRAIATPGHTPGSMSFLWQGDDAARVFTGDTLLIGGCGRTDFQGGSSEQLWHSVTQRLFTLPGDTVVLPGHDYHGQSQSSIAAEKRDNPRFVGHTLESFVAQMAALELPPPRRIAEAVPANKRAGAPPDVAEEIQQA